MKNLTKGALKKMVAEEMAKQKRLKEEGNVSAATPGYLTPKAFTKKRYER